MNPLGWFVLKALEVPAQVVESGLVNCGNCPVSIACLAKQQVAWRFPCCGTSAVPVESLKGEHVTLVVDCSINGFASTEPHDFLLCPLCSGDVLYAELRGWSALIRWLPTAHAKNAVSVRLAHWRSVLPAQRERVNRDAKIRERENVKP